MKVNVVDILETFCPDDVYLHGTISDSEDYPEEFITYFTDSSEFGTYYDDKTDSVIWELTVIYYSSDPEKVLSVPPQILKRLEEEGFLPQGAGEDVPSGIKTHTGWAMRFLYPEEIENEEIII